MVLLGHSVWQQQPQHASHSLVCSITHTHIHTHVQQPSIHPGKRSEKTQVAVLRDAPCPLSIGLTILQDSLVPKNTTEALGLLSLQFLGIEEVPLPGETTRGRRLLHGQVVEVGGHLFHSPCPSRRLCPPGDKATSLRKLARAAP